MGYTHFDKISAENGIAIGAKGSETVCVSSAGVVQTSAGTELLGVVPVHVEVNGTSTAALSTYTVAPIAGNVTGYVTWVTSAGTGRAVTVYVGSAGAELLQMTAVGNTGTLGAVSTLTNTSGTTAITKGASIRIGMASCATAQPIVGCTLMFTPTA